MLALVILASIGHAAPAATPNTIETITAAHSAQLASIFNQQQRNMADGCTGIKITRAKAIQVAGPIQLNAAGQPTKGLWRVRFEVDACGTKAYRMAQFTVGPMGTSIDALAPGETLADPKLQADVTKSFTMAGQVMMPNCNQDAVIRDTKLRVFPAKIGRDRWAELWVGHMCGRDIGQVVDFLPTKSGTTFKMSLPKKR